jgi:hypothetical protein
VLVKVAGEILCEGIRIYMTVTPVKGEHIYLCARHVHAYVLPLTLPMNLPDSEREMPWHGGYDGVLPTSETKGKTLVSAVIVVINAAENGMVMTHPNKVPCSYGKSRGESRT